MVWSGYPGVRVWLNGTVPHQTAPGSIKRQTGKKNASYKSLIYHVNLTYIGSEMAESEITSFD